MPTPFEVHTVAQQFNRVQDELAVLRGMVRELLAHPSDEDVPVGKPVDQPPTEAPEPRAPLAGKPVHFDGHHWRQGPSPEPSDADKAVGQG